MRERDPGLAPRAISRSVGAYRKKTLLTGVLTGVPLNFVYSLCMGFAKVPFKYASTQLLRSVCSRTLVD
jgi:hypothetical protein